MKELKKIIIDMIDEKYLYRYAGPWTSARLVG
jgi:hypothetical protein